MTGFVIPIPCEIRREVDKLHPNNKLFGSRYMSSYFGYSDRAKESDWDFCFPYEGSEWDEVHKATKLGWSEKPTEKYRDDMHFMTWEKYIGHHKVQMCSKINMSVFIETFQSINPDFYWKYLHKSSASVLPKTVQTDIFNQLYKTNGW